MALLFIPKKFSIRDINAVMRLQNKLTDNEWDLRDQMFVRPNFFLWFCLCTDTSKREGKRRGGRSGREWKEGREEDDCYIPLPLF